MIKRDKLLHVIVGYAIFYVSNILLLLMILWPGVTIPNGYMKLICYAMVLLAAIWREWTNRNTTGFSLNDILATFIGGSISHVSISVLTYILTI